MFISPLIHDQILVLYYILLKKNLKKAPQDPPEYTVFILFSFVSNANKLLYGLILSRAMKVSRVWGGGSTFS